MEKDKNELAQISSLIDKDKVRLRLTEYTRQGEYFSINPKINYKVKVAIVDIIQNQLEYCKKLTIKHYNIVGADDDTIEEVAVSEYEDAWTKITHSFETLNEIKNINMRDYDFFTYELNLTNKDNIFFLRRVNKMKSIKSGFLGKLFNGEFSKIETSNLLGIDNNIDLIIYKNKFYILRHIALERILKLKDQFREKAEDVLNNELFTEKIKNFDRLKEQALDNANYIKRLAKLHDNKGTLFLDRIEETEKVIERFSLDIEVKNGVLIYRDDTQVGNFINLMQDSYYQTLIGKENGVNERR